MLKLMAIAALTLPSLASAGWVSAPLANIRLIATSGDVTFGPPVVQGNCPNNDFYVIRAANNARAALDMLVAAKAAGFASISIYIDDANPCDPYYQRPAFTQLMLAPTP